MAKKAKSKSVTFTLGDITPEASGAKLKASSIMEKHWIFNSQDRISYYGLKKDTDKESDFVYKITAPRSVVFLSLVTQKDSELILKFKSFADRDLWLGRLLNQRP